MFTTHVKSELFNFEYNTNTKRQAMSFHYMFDGITIYFPVVIHARRKKIFQPFVLAQMAVILSVNIEIVVSQSSME